MTVLINGGTGRPVDVPEQFVERFLAAGFKRPAVKESPKSSPRRKKPHSDE